MTIDPLPVEAIQKRLATLTVGRHLFYLAETRSTNDEARRLAVGGAPDGTVVVADYQSAGRGRLDRRWEAPPGSSLLLSVIVRPALLPEHAQQLTMLSALAAADAVAAATGLDVGLKWPNDLLIGGRKVGGILTELELSAQAFAAPRLAYAIIGIGLNVNLDPAALPAPLLARATSLSAELGHAVDRPALLLALLARLDERYHGLQARSGALRREWAARLVTLGRRVAVSSGDAEWAGVAEDVDKDGALLVRLPRGRLVRVVAGDVRVVD